MNVSGIVYSTNPDYKLEGNREEDSTSLPPAEQKIRIRLETKHRGGKAVTLVENFIAPNSIKEEIGKKLKTFCGTGGSVKDGEILVQGDNREKILQWFLKNGYKNSKRV